MPLSPTTAAGSAGTTTGNAIGQIPKFDPQATNLLLFSQALDNAAWLGAAVVTADATMAPDGTLTAETVNDNSGVATLDKNQTAVIANDSLPYTASAYILAGSSRQMRLQLDLSGGVPVSASIDLDPVSGNVIAANAFGYAVTAIQVGAATWLRVSVTAANNNTGNTNAKVTLQPASNGIASQGTVIAWGMQLEKQLSATGYIPTAGQQVTRTAGRLPAWTLDNAEVILAKTGAYPVDALADKGKCITGAGTFTISLPAAASAGNGFWVEVKNIGAGTLTIQANGAELMYMPGAAKVGANSFTLPYSGSLTGPYNVSSAKFVSDGAVWQVTATAETHGRQLFTANGTWTAPDGVTAVWVSAVAGGGGGGGSLGGGTAAGAGGGGGAIANRVLLSVVPGTAYGVTIGGGGAAGANNGGNGGTGGTTSFGGLLSLAGGGGGQGNTQAPGAGGAGNQGGGAALIGDGASITYSQGGMGGGVGGGKASTGAGMNGTAGAANSGGGGAGSVGSGFSGGSGGSGYLLVEW